MGEEVPKFGTNKPLTHFDKSHFQAEEGIGPKINRENKLSTNL
jgi:hypothetical protein